MHMISAILAVILAVTVTGCGMNQNVNTTTGNDAVTSSDSVNVKDGALIASTLN